MSASEMMSSLRTRPDEFHQFVELYGLREAADRFHAVRDSLRVVVRRYNDDGNPANGFIRQLNVPEFLARHDRHHQVENDQGRVMGSRQVISFGAVRGGDNRCAVGLERHDHESAQIGIVFNDQNRTG